MVARRFVERGADGRAWCAGHATTVALLIVSAVLVLRVLVVILRNDQT